ncbi:MAG: transcription termination factor Rho [Verrucomicrobia bacterium]|jgi:transcription termination factor Rho|nr:MAG: transcription termination factor Rho [Verrucomicrobiota bacterium]MDH4469463.1 transcription termination factor Rho [Verrucomicrobiae bacterium]
MTSSENFPDQCVENKESFNIVTETHGYDFREREDQHHVEEPALIGKSTNQLEADNQESKKGEEVVEDSITTSAQPSAAPLDVENRLSLNDLQSLSYHELLKRSQSLNLFSRDNSLHGLILSQARHQILSGGPLHAEGILEFSPDQPLLRWPAFNFAPCPEDLLVPVALLKKYQLRAGLRIAGIIRVFNQRRLVLHEITSIEGIPADDWKSPKEFDQLTATFPNKRILLEQSGDINLTGRAIDLVAPLGMGQRGLIIAPPRTGKTTVLKNIALAIRANHPNIHLIVLLVDERPEEVTDLRRSLDCDIVSSTFDEPTERHVQVSEMVSERSKRLVELGQDVVILIDSITRLARGYNNAITGKGRTMSGGVDSKALARPKRFFGSARNVEEGGSLTILATALIETQSRMDDLIFEEFKGTGNMEIMLDRSIAEQRIFPAIHLVKSATRREELLYHPDELHRIVALRSSLLELPAVEGIQLLLQNIDVTSSNTELLLTGLRGI